MKKIVYLVLGVFISLQSCDKVNCENIILPNEKIVFKSSKENNPYKVKLLIKGGIDCNSDIILMMDGKTYRTIELPKGNLDTLIVNDWYSNILELEFKSKNCVINKLEVCCTFY